MNKVADRKQVAGSLSILLILLMPLAAPGRVFFNRLIAKDSAIFDTAGWRRIYQAPMVLNGSRLTFSAYGCDAPFQLVMAKLQPALQPSNAGRQVAHALVIPLPDPDQTIVFSVRPSPPEFFKSSAAADANESFGATLLPGSIRHTNIRNEETGAMLETRFSSAAPENVINEAAKNLEQRGWKIVSPAGGRGAFAVFQRSAELCVVSAAPAVAAGQALQVKQTRVTILVKSLK